MLSPRITAKTMSLHPAVAFAAALIGGGARRAPDGVPRVAGAGVIQSAVKEWGHRYDVVESGLTARTAHDRSRPKDGWMQRLRQGSATTEPPDEPD